MEIIYAFGIFCIKILQERCQDFEDLIKVMNHMFSLSYFLEFVFPLVSAYDSVFGAQLLLSVAFGGWCNTMIKWIIVEDRPYWWIRETTYYGNEDRPSLKQFYDTCETGPGSPSGHCAAAATIFILSEMWLSHIVRDLKSARLESLYKMMPFKTIFFTTMFFISLARMYVGAHFPHQCLLGALVGSLVSPWVCLFITDPYLFRNTMSPGDVRRSYIWHVAMASLAIALSMLVGFVYLMIGVDIHWSTRLAFRWCHTSDFINVKTLPIFSIVQSTGSLLGWALTVTPEIAKFRHYTPCNSIVALLTSCVGMYSFKYAKDYIPQRKMLYYTAHFVLNLVRPYVFLRLVPKMGLVTHFGRQERQPRQSKVPVPQATSGVVRRG